MRGMAAFACGVLCAGLAHGQVTEEKRPAFEVATIRPMDPKGGSIVAGFLGFPGGRVTLGAASVRMLIYYAFKVQDYQIAGGPDWTATERYNIAAQGLDATDPAKALPMTASPSEQQRQMLQALLIERFGLKFHRETREGNVFVLSRGSGELQMQPAKDKERDADPRGTVMNKGGGIWDGEAFGTNVSMAFVCGQIFARLGRPVLDQTGLTGTYDFHLQPNDPENTDMTTAMLGAASRLGLKLKSAKGPVETIVIDGVTRPTEN